MNRAKSIQEEKLGLENANQVTLTLAQYIYQVSQISAKIPDQVADFLSSYLASLRRNCSLESLRSLQDLVSILEKCAKSHARLCKRGIVEMEDAIVAIYLLEDSLWAQWGIGLIGRWKMQEELVEQTLEESDCYSLKTFTERLCQAIFGNDEQIVDENDE